MKALCAALAALFAWVAVAHPVAEIRYTTPEATTHATINTQEGGTP